MKQEEAIEPKGNEIFGDHVWMKDQEFDTAITHVILEFVCTVYCFLAIQKARMYRAVLSVYMF